ncbi:type I-U CRISPR-associated protein Csb2 [Nocardiopsis sp. CNT312]|uniref:type I-G CRISPR-associated protein Csb2 n=1 Tax=Nocardiopsis sp. CNT312 TaxID=1137268 RepID=UPI00048D9AF1|nr:type I-U CRISPR-associated protein Csb2 [Nocardiopsis sp. CNT312]
MALVMSVRLREGRYDAASGWAETVEWPPAPSRLFCALVASDPTREERLALAWLEQQPPPQVWASGLEGRFRTDTFVVTNKTNSGGGSTSLPGRTNAPRTRVSALPSVSEVAFVWPDAAPSRDVVQVLGDLAWKVPYLGRSTSTVAIRVHTRPEMRPEWTVYEPTTLDGRTDAVLGIPFPGYLDALDEAFERGVSAWEVGRTIGYAARRTAPAASTTPTASRTVQGPFASMMVFAFAQRTVRPGADELLSLTGKLRESVMARMGETVPAQVSGHDDQRRRHVAFVGLPDVGHPQARGTLFGLALVLPRDLEPQAAAALHQTMVRDRFTHLNRGHGPVFRLDYQAEPSGPRALDPSRWAMPWRGSRVWVSATPLMLDRYTRPNSDLAHCVSEAVVNAGYPAPVDVEVSQAPLTQGAMLRPRQGSYPKGRPRRKVLHARIEFPEPVTGPVLAGSMRYLGLGLFEPVPDADVQAPGSERGREVVHAAQ